MARLVPKTTKVPLSSILGHILIPDPHGEYFEFQGGNFELGNYCDALYRAFAPTVKLTDDMSLGSTNPHLEVPSRLEALTYDGTWQQHPVVFKRNESPNGFDLVVFLTGKHYSSTYVPAGSSKAKQLLREAQRLGLTQGTTTGIRSIVREIID